MNRLLTAIRSYWRGVFHGEYYCEIHPMEQLVLVGTYPDDEFICPVCEQERKDGGA